MKSTLFKSAVILLTLFLFFSCSDSTKELSGGYFLRMEGKDVNDILPHGAEEKEIPSNVLTFNYNKDFIIASQEPNKIDDPLYTKVDYKEGREKVYYWLIVHSKKLILGPMSKHDLDVARKIYKVPPTLVLKALD